MRVEWEEYRDSLMIEYLVLNPLLKVLEGSFSACVSGSMWPNRLEAVPKKREFSGVILALV